MGEAAMSRKRMKQQRCNKDPTAVLPVATLKVRGIGPEVKTEARRCRPFVPEPHPEAPEAFFSRAAFCASCGKARSFEMQFSA